MNLIEPENLNQAPRTRDASTPSLRSSERGMRGRYRCESSWSSLRNRLRGSWNYYGVIENSRLTWKCYREVTRIIFKWLNRRSQRKSYTWVRFGELWGKPWDSLRPRVCEKQVKTETGELELV